MPEQYVTVQCPRCSYGGEYGVEGFEPCRVCDGDAEIEVSVAWLERAMEKVTVSA